MPPGRAALVDDRPSAATSSATVFAAASALPTLVGELRCDRPPPSGTCAGSLPFGGEQLVEIDEDRRAVVLAGADRERAALAASRP